MLINQTNKFVKDLGLVLGRKAQWDLNAKPINSSCMTTWMTKGLKAQRTQSWPAIEEKGSELGLIASLPLHCEVV